MAFLSPVAPDTWNKIQVNENGIHCQSCLWKEESVRSAALSPDGPQRRALGEQTVGAAQAAKFGRCLFACFHNSRGELVQSFR